MESLEISDVRPVGLRCVRETTGAVISKFFENCEVV